MSVSMVLMFVGLGILPTGIALSRNHHAKLAIAAVNLVPFIGTVVSTVIALGSAGAMAMKEEGLAVLGMIGSYGLLGVSLTIMPFAWLVAFVWSLTSVRQQHQQGIEAIGPLAMLSMAQPRLPFEADRSRPPPSSKFDAMAALVVVAAAGGVVTFLMVGWDARRVPGASAASQPVAAGSQPVGVPLLFETADAEWVGASNSRELRLAARVANTGQALPVGLACELTALVQGVKHTGTMECGSSDLQPGARRPVDGRVSVGDYAGPEPVLLVIRLIQRHGGRTHTDRAWGTVPSPAHRKRFPVTMMMEAE